MSADKDQEYFSDGLTEELSTCWRKIQKLRVTSRTSAFSFKGKETDIKTIARKAERNTCTGRKCAEGRKPDSDHGTVDRSATDSHLWSADLRPANGKHFCRSR